MNKYRVEMKYIKVWDEEIEALNDEEAERIAQKMADSEDEILDINERECVVLAGVEKIDWEGEK